MPRSQDFERPYSGRSQEREKRYRVDARIESRPPASYEKRIRIIRIVASVAVGLALATVVALCVVPIEDYYSAPGVVWPAEYRDLYAPADGITSETLVREDEVVTAGQILMRFDLPELREQILDVANDIRVLEARLAAQRMATSVKEILPLPKDLWEISMQLDQSRAAVAFHESQLKRYQELRKSGSASQREVEKAQFDYDQAKIECQRLESRVGLLNREGYSQAIIGEARAAEKIIERDLEKARSKLRDLQAQFDRNSVLRAPVGGRILDINNYHPGEQNKRGQLLVYMSVGDRRIVEIAGDQQNFDKVEVGQTVRYSSRTYDPLKYGYAEGHVYRISPIRGAVDIGDARANAEPRYSIKATIDREPKELKLSSNVMAEIVLRKDRLYRVLLGLDRADKK